MNKFATGMLLGGAAALMGVGYLMQDQKRYRKSKKANNKANTGLQLKSTATVEALVAATAN